MTRLTALELFGFKSFADRTRFEFPAGITVVVGPNGSGKSNVVDAIKWVLGEQSVRSLRGKEMTDVIFAGSTDRRPLNAAEVSLVFDNAARLLPVAGDEVRITRRVYRSGESEYLVNGEASRLRDIRELFSGTGAATEAYSVIEQGRVDALLVASGRDRRAVFEEAAGITRFRTRRGEALRRLERAELNRQRLADIVGEVASRLETVRHQAARARRWRSMQDRLRMLRIVASTRDLAGVDADVAAVENNLQADREEARRAEGKAAEAATAATTATEAAATLHPRLAEARAASTTDTQRAAAAEATAALQRARRPDLEAGCTRAADALRQAVAERRRAAAAATAARAEEQSIGAALDDIASRLSRLEHAVAGSQDDAATARRTLAEALTALDAVKQQRMRLEHEHDRAAARAADTHAAAAAARDVLDAARLRQARLGEAQAACEGHVVSLEERLAAASRDLDSLDVARRQKSSALQTAWGELAGWRAALEACRERRSVLAEIVARQEGVSEAARRLLADGAEQAPRFAGVLADVVVAAVQWAPLVDLALGALGQSIVVDSLDDAIAWHTAWSRTEQARGVLSAGGRIGFVAPHHLREPEAFDPGPHPGFVGRLDRLLASDAGHSEPDPLLSRLLGRVWIVERIEHALPMRAAAPAGTLFMTRAGACLTVEGSFEVGTPAAAVGLVARRSELRALDARQEDLGRAVAAASATVESVQADLSTLEEEIQQATNLRQQAAETIASSRTELARVLRDQKSAAEGSAGAERDVRAADQQAAEAEAAARVADSALELVEPTVAAALAEADRSRAALAALEQNRGEVIEELQRLQVERAARAERHARGRDAAAACLAACSARQADVEAARQQQTEAHARLLAYELESLAAGAAHAEAAWAAQGSTALLAALASEAESLDAARRQAATAIEEARAAATGLAERIHALELQAGEARHRRARIVERIRDEYDIDIDAAPPAADAAELEQVPQDRADLETAIEELRRKLASMTAVNLEALTEAEQLAERLSALETQLADVGSAKESIEQLIARIDDDSRRLLGETIETVRGHFRELFERVFGGGQADIVLEPGVDLLETSVEIVARPPGKEPRSISLLSGGEKTMTCVALLLAIFRSRPSPFCVLDEVDAALDEANVDRFVGVLRDFLSSTQFIVVTHSKKTMAAATTLYGVTMEESGVSKRVSVRFESAATSRAKAA
jgi:chromosome segregation protein